MGAVFEKVEASILDIEKGYSNNSTDAGGETKWGISKHQYPLLNIATLTQSDALLILERDYWDRYRLNEINDQGIADQIFFLLVNTAPIPAGKVIQTAVNKCGGNLTIDGILGSDSFDSINELHPDWLSDRIRIEEIKYYLKLTDTYASQCVNFRGWVRRALYEENG